jgi:hypothetical protein
MCIKTKFGAKNKAFCDTCFVLLYLSQKTWDFHETLGTNIDFRGIHAKLFFGIF